MAVGLDFQNWTLKSNYGDKIAVADYPTLSFLVNADRYENKIDMAYRVNDFAHEFKHLTPENFAMYERDKTSCFGWSSCSYERDAIEFSNGLRKYWDTDYLFSK